LRNKAILFAVGAATIAGAATFVAPMTPEATRPTKPRPKVTVAGLTWENSLGDALAIAQKTNKPVLHLQMFGKLDDAFC